MNKNLLFKLQNDVREMEQRSARAMTDEDADRLAEKARYILDTTRRMIFMQVDDLIDECKNVEQLRNLEMDLIRLAAKFNERGE